MATADEKFAAFVARPPGWQRAFHKTTRRALAGSTTSRLPFLMPNERTALDVQRMGQDTDRHGRVWG